MTNGEERPAGDRPPADEFACVLSEYQAADRAVQRARAAFERAQDAFEAGRAALTVPRLMRHPVVRVTDRDSLEKIASLLRMTTIGGAINPEADELFEEVVTYRESLDLLKQQIDPDGRGDEAMRALIMARVALDRLLIAPPRTVKDLYQKMAAITAASAQWNLGECLAFLTEDARQLAEREVDHAA